MSVTTSLKPGHVIPEEMLLRFRERAPIYDRKNRFFQEDFDELKRLGYLTLPVPADVGGPGFTLGEVGREQRRLAMFAPADAVALNMHLYWAGTASDLHGAGDPSMDIVLKEALAGEVFAAGHAEKGNDLAGMYSTTKAQPVEGGYRFTGHKSFGTMTPVWTRLGLWGMDSTDPANRKMVHGFLARADGGFRIEEVWDSLGMRATRSDDTVLEGSFVPSHRIPRVVSTGAAGMDLFLLSLYMWVECGFANVYCGIAKRALELAIESVKSKKSIAIGSGTYAHHPGYQHLLADMAILCHAMEPVIDSVADGYAASVLKTGEWAADTGGTWAQRGIGAKVLVTDQAFQVLDMAVEAFGGFGVSRQSEIERLFRDARMGKIHPANTFLAREMIGKMLLGIDMDAQPRWG
jgi:alkylation response protein AidB-like acyl-CoA dehydrogenase